MATGKHGQSQNSGQGQERGQPSKPVTQNGGSAGRVVEGAGERLREAGQHARESLASVGERAKETYGEARESAVHGYEQARDVVGRHPMSSVFVGFGLGFGVGMLLTVILNQREDTWYDRYVPNRLRGFPDSLRHLGDAMRDIPDHLRHLPEAVAKYMPSR
jgi:ElaB/YqjD/DUF883 family membrane-anchored ribosome-binding protein